MHRYEERNRRKEEKEKLQVEKKWKFQIQTMKRSLSTLSRLTRDWVENKNLFLNKFVFTTQKPKKKEQQGSILHQQTTETTFKCDVSKNQPSSNNEPTERK
jgi:hypothetical protein